MKKVKGIFIGADGSCGYEHNKEYHFFIEHAAQIIIITSPHYVQYESVFSFLNNWKEVSLITAQT